MENLSQAFDSLTNGLLPTATAVQTTDSTTSHHRHHTTPTQLLITDSSTETQQISFTQSTPTPAITRSTSATLRQTTSSSSALSPSANSPLSSTASATSSASSSQLSSSTATVSANPVGGPTETSSASAAKHEGGSSVSTAGIAIGVILSLVVLGAMSFLIYRQRERFLACVARHHGRKPGDEEEVQGLKRDETTRDLADETVHHPNRERPEVTPREANIALGASLDRPFSHPVMVDNSNDPEISPTNIPATGSGYNSEAISPLSLSRYKPWATSYTYMPYTYSRPSSTASPNASKSHMGPPGRVLPAYGKPKAKTGVWEVDTPSHQLLGNDTSQAPH